MNILTWVLDDDGRHCFAQVMLALFFQSAAIPSTVWIVLHSCSLTLCLPLFTLFLGLALRFELLQSAALFELP